MSHRPKNWTSRRPERSGSIKEASPIPKLALYEASEDTTERSLLRGQVYARPDVVLNAKMATGPSSSTVNCYKDRRGRRYIGSHPAILLDRV